MATTTPAAKAPSLPRALVLAALLVLVDAFWFNQGIFSLLIGLGLIFIALPRAFLPKFRATRRARLRNIGIYLIAVVIVLGVIRVNNRIAARRADDVVAAVKAFHAQNGRYPDSLDALVPAFLTAVPRAKYTLQFDKFMYIKTESSALLYYVAIPPFGRPTFDFARDSWGYID
jgi:hypothetical protein